MKSWTSFVCCLSCSRLCVVVYMFLLSVCDRLMNKFMNYISTVSMAVGLRLLVFRVNLNATQKVGFKGLVSHNHFSKAYDGTKMRECNEDIVFLDRLVRR